MTKYIDNGRFIYFLFDGIAEPMIIDKKETDIELIEGLLRSDDKVGHSIKEEYILEGVRNGWSYSKLEKWINIMPHTAMFKADYDMKTFHLPKWDTSEFSKVELRNFVSLVEYDYRMFNVLHQRVDDLLFIKEFLSIPHLKEKFSKLENSFRVYWNHIRDGELSKETFFTFNDQRIRAEIHLNEQLDECRARDEDGEPIPYDETYDLGEFILVPPTTYEDLAWEGFHMNNCIGAYSKWVEDGTDMIYFMRRAEEPDKPFADIDVDKGELEQVLMFNNYYPPEEVLNYVFLWTEAMGIPISDRFNSCGIEPPESFIESLNL